MRTKPFFSPDSILVAGVSESPNNLARRIVENLFEFDYRGTVHLLGVRPGNVRGIVISTSMDDVPDGIELAVFLTPARTVPGLMDDCGRKGIRHAAVLSGGFKELGEEGASLEEELLEVARRHQIRFVGPNCVGLMSPSSGLGAVFAPVTNRWRPGGVSIAAQSGGVGFSYLYGLVSENLGLARFASIGNKLDLDETDYVGAFANDDDTEVVALYLESISRGRDFFDAVKACPKPIVVQKTNRTDLGRRTAFSHTAALAADDRIVDAAIRQAGAVRASSINGVMDAVKAMMLPSMTGSRLALISRSGGHAVIASDYAADAGFSFPEFPEEYLSSIGTSYVNEVIHKGNPLDLGDLFDFEAYARILEGALALDEVDAAVLIHEYFSNVEPGESRKLVPKAAELGRKYGKPAVLVMITDAAETAHLKQMYEDPFFTSVGAAFKALSAIRARGRYMEARTEDPSSDPLPREVREAAVTASESDAGMAAFDLLNRAGIGTPRQRLFGPSGEPSWDGPFPVAVKVASHRAIHKTDMGGVVLGVGDRDSLSREIREMSGRFGPFGEGEGVLVQAMADEGTEWIVGGLRDPGFGPVVLVGAGGVLVEVLDDTAMRLAPVTIRQAREMIEELAAAHLLDGARGSPPGDREALARTIERVGRIMYECPEVRELDINPCIVHEHGLTAVDVRIKSAG